MNVPVESSWSACSLAVPLFADPWENQTGIEATKTPQGVGLLE